MYIISSKPELTTRFLGKMIENRLPQIQNHSFPQPTTTPHNLHHHPPSPQHPAFHLVAIPHQSPQSQFPTPSPSLAERFHTWQLETIEITHKWISAIQSFIISHGAHFSECEKTGFAILQIQPHYEYMNAHIPRGTISNSML